MSDSYVCSGAMMRCTMGTSPANLTVLPVRTVNLTGPPMANISDHKSMVNLAPFGLCRSLGFPPTASATAAAHGHLTPMPCMHNTPAPWMGGKMDYLIKGQPALLKSCKCQCMWGGTISLVTDGQVGEGVQWVQKKPKDIGQNNSNTSGNNEQYQSIAQSNQNQSKSALEKISSMIDRAKWWWQHRKYIKNVKKTKYEYKPEAIDITLSQKLKTKLNEIKAVEEMSTKTLVERVDFVENTLVPQIIDTMDLDKTNLAFNWYKANNGELGYYSESDRSLNINTNVLDSTDTNTIKVLLNTVIHEFKHAQQYDEITGRKDHGYSKELKEQWKENMGNYISPDESDEGYMKQPVELDAWEFADSVIPDGLLESFKSSHNKL